MRKIILFILLLLPLFIFSQGIQGDSYKGTTTGTNSYSVTINAITAQAPYDGQKIIVKFANANSAASSLVVTVAGGTSYAVKDIETSSGAALGAGNLPANSEWYLVYNSSFNSWQILGGVGSTPVSSGWSLTGDAGTVDGTNFIGTTDNIPFNIKVNNVRAGRIDNTLNNTFFGYAAGNNITTGSHNTAMGTSALQANLAGIQNTVIGSGAGSSIIGTGNTSIGYGSMALVTTGADYNTAIGISALGSNTTGDGNVAIGRSAGFYETGSNKLFVDNDGRANEADARIKAMMYGVFASTVSTQSLTINAQLRINDGTVATGRVLTAKADGFAEWAAPTVSTNYWTASGNDIYNNNTENVGVNNTTPDARLSVVSTNSVVTINSTSSNANTSIAIDAYSVSTINGSINNVIVANADAANNGYNNSISAFASNGLEPRAGTFGAIGGTIATGATFSASGASSANYAALFPQGRVGIGTNTPSTLVHITGSSGSLRYVDGSQGANKVLTSDANGVATWATPSGTPTLAQVLTAGRDADVTGEVNSFSSDLFMDINQFILYSTTGSPAKLSINTDSRNLYGINDRQTLNYQSGYLYDNNYTPSRISCFWTLRLLQDTGEGTSIDWNTRMIYDEAYNNKIDYRNDTLFGNWTNKGDLTVTEEIIQDDAYTRNQTVLLADDATYTVTKGGAAGKVTVISYENSGAASIDGFIQFIFVAYPSSGAGILTQIATVDGINEAVSDLDGFLCAYMTGENITIKNRLGASRNIMILLDYF